MAAVSKGRIRWSLRRDDEGYRNYEVVSRVVTTDYLDGPQQVMTASGLLAIGSAYSYGNDFDPWATCYPTMDVSPVVDKEPNKQWDVTQFFSNRPLKRCQDTTIESPFMEPAKLSGSFMRRTKLITEDRNGNPILSSGLDTIQGITRDDSKPTVVIEQNVASIDLDQFDEFMNSLNDAELWGLPARCVKLSNIVWSRRLFGICNYYYTRRFEFEIDRNTWDESKILDRSFQKFDTKRHPTAANDSPLRDDPNNYVRIRDKNGEVVPDPLCMDGFGNINTDPYTSPAYIPKVEKYDEKNLLELGIPSIIT